ncbi:amino acid ABC transporter [Loktanella sp. D2R18]|uniref:transporter substrate-binding domain-containing protein n=1 Tax=Rhodobacterales TaxID=204455 RepID=UPI000DEA06C6|nr:MULTISPECIES: transporter substrate-binding domain-containing protein [Rhodobacterales]MDO6589432.1 transporter substrate-binding domain-containing protein [Yoonia sp. 1_MG-2023]RBW45161.1 amino acid ABC transporter [Loktanella sp. D2R18]
MIKTLRKTASWVAALATAATLSAVPASAQEMSTWDQIQETGVLRIGVTQAPPWFSKNPATGEWDSGLGITIGQNMADTLGVDLEVVEVTWGTAVAALQSNKIDAMPVLDPKPDRAMSVAFPSNPLLYISLAVLANEDLAADTWAELNSEDVSIAVPQGSSMDTYVTANLPLADIQRFPDNGAAIAAYQSGRVDAVSLFHPPLLAARQRLGTGQLVIPTPAFSSPTSIAVRQEDDQRFLNWVDTSIFYWYETGQTQGWYADFLTEFGLDPAASPVIQRELMFNN